MNIKTPCTCGSAGPASLTLAYYSVDGVVWTRAASFTDTSVPNFIGPFASNYNPNPQQSCSGSHGDQLVQHPVMHVRMADDGWLGGEVLL